MLEPLAQSSPGARTLCNLCVALDMVGRQADAQATYRRGLAAAPADADLHGNLAFSLAISGDTEAALRSMQTAAALPSGQAWQPANLVLLLAMAGRGDAAWTRAQAAGMPDETLIALLDPGRRARGATTPGGPRRSAWLPGRRRRQGRRKPPFLRRRLRRKRLHARRGCGRRRLCRWPLFRGLARSRTPIVELW